jgi:hypothetical protein
MEHGSHRTNAGFRQIDGALIALASVAFFGCGSGATAEPQAGAGGASAGASTSVNSTVDSGVTSSTAGAGGHVVSSCDALKGAAPGTWEDITPPSVNRDPAFQTPAGANFGVHSFAIDPHDARTIYLGTSAQGLYKTTDCGATWAHINTGMNGSMLDQGRQWTLVVDPVDPGVLYTNSGYGPLGAWKSTNGGVDWEPLLPPDVAQVLIFGGFVHLINMDPTDHLHLIVTPHFDCQGNHDKNCLLETFDAGKTWHVVEGTPGNEEASSMFIIDKKTWMWTKGWGGLWRTEDAGASWKQVYMGTTTPEWYRTKAGVFYMAAMGDGVLESKDAITWGLIPSAPGAFTVAGDDVTLYAAWSEQNGAPFEPYRSAKLGDLTSSGGLNWSPLTSPMMTRGPWSMRHDPDHSLLYSMNPSTTEGSDKKVGGFWRLVTN